MVAINQNKFEGHLHESSLLLGSLDGGGERNESVIVLLDNTFSFARSTLKWGISGGLLVGGLYLFCWLMVHVSSKHFICSEFYYQWVCVENCALTSRNLSLSCPMQVEVGVDVGALLHFGYIFSSSLSVIGSSTILRTFSAPRSPCRAHQIWLIVMLSGFDLLLALSNIMSSSLLLLGFSSSLGSFWLGEFSGACSATLNFIFVLNLFVMIFFPSAYSAWVGKQRTLGLLLCTVVVIALIHVIGGYVSGNIVVIGGYRIVADGWQLHYLVFAFFTMVISCAFAYFYLCTALSAHHLLPTPTPGECAVWADYVAPQFLAATLHSPVCRPGGADGHLHRGLLRHLAPPISVRWKRTP
jgi:hypothetical protein